jgi:glucose-6-phosphate dehydrogenase assembly protein OpcA
MNQVEDSGAAFARGDAIEVPVDGIELALAALWRQAAEATHGTGEQQPVTRACLWNLVVCVDDLQHMGAAKRLIEEVADRISTRTLVMASDTRGRPGVRAWVEAKWRRRPGGAASGSDEVTLLASGGAAARLPSLVRALQNSDAPTAMLFPRALPPLSSALIELVLEADRLIVDTRKLASEEQLGDVLALATRHAKLELADLSWIGISPLRGLCASLFDAPRDPSVLLRLDRVRVTSNIPVTQARGLLALGWLAACLGWGEITSSDRDPSLRRWRARRNDGGCITMELATEPGHGMHGVAGLELQAGGDIWSLARANCIEVRGPGIPSRTQPARSHSDAELASAALGLRGRDPLYREALARAVALVQS